MQEKSGPHHQMDHCANVSDPLLGDTPHSLVRTLTDSPHCSNKMLWNFTELFSLLSPLPSLCPPSPQVLTCAHEQALVGRSLKTSSKLHFPSDPNGTHLKKFLMTNKTFEKSFCNWVTEFVNSPLCSYPTRNCLNVIEIKTCVKRQYTI